MYKMKKITKWIVFMLVTVILVGCGKDNKIDLNQDIKKVEVNYVKDGIDCRVVIDFATSSRKVNIYGSQNIETEDSYAYLDEFEKFIRDYVLVDKELYVKGNKSSNETQDDQRILWRIRVTFADGSWAQVESMEHNPYNPEYYNTLIDLVEK